MFDQLGADSRQRFDAHIKRDAGHPGDGRPIQIAGIAGAALLGAGVLVILFFFVAGDDRKTGIQIAMGDGNPRISGRRDRRADARHNLKSNSRSAQRQAFLAAPSKDKRIAALEAHHQVSLTRQVDQ